MYRKNNETTKNITTMAILCAVTVVLQTIGAMFPLKVMGISISLVLIPLAVSACFYGITGGVIIGGVFGLTVFVHSVIGLDPAGATILAINPLFTIFITVLRGILAGLLTGVVAGFVKHIQNKSLRYVLIAIVAPIFNTGIFILFYFLLFKDMLIAGAADSGFGDNIFGFIIMGVVGINFLFELITTAILTSPICKAIEKINN